jgi:PAS domain S-box-containing protein
MRLRTKIILAFSLMLMFTAALFGIVTFRAQENALLSGIDATLLATARLASEILPSNYHDKISSVDSVSDAEYIQIVDRWNRLCKQMGLEYIWSLMLIDGKIVFTSGSSTSKDVNQGDHARFFEAHSNPELYETAFATMEPQYQIMNDKWGRIKVTLLPFKDILGRPYLFGASMKMTEVDALMRITIWRSLEVTAGILIFGVFISVQLASSMVQPLEKLMDLAHNISNGNWGQVAETSGTIEIQNLAHSINKMSQSIHEKINESKQAEQELIRSHEVLKTILDRSPFGVAVIGRDRKIRWANHYVYTLVGMKDATGLFGKECGEYFCTALQKECPILDWGQMVNNSERILRRQDGMEIPILKTVIEIEMNGESVLLETFVDITERKKAEEEKAKFEARLQQAQKMESIGSLAGGIAHDLNNILFPISGLSEMLLDDIPPGDPARESIEQIYKSTQRGSDLVKQILAFSRQSNPRKLPIRIQSILKEVLKLVRSAIPMNIEISSHIKQDCGMVSADPTQVHQILMNLITNAYHAVEGNGGTINVELKETTSGWNIGRSHPAFGEKDDLHGNSMPEDILAGRYACITLSDTGTGIDPTLIDKIFDPYFTTKEPGKGTGLGLSVVHGIVKEHRGDIRVYSEVGKGTAFHVYLPIIEDETDGKDSAVTREYPTGCERILLVDDEEPIVRMEQMMLARLGYQVTTRMSSPDALAAFKANPGNFDLVISDRGMPNMTGDQLARELISIRPEISVIICTGFCDENDENRSMDLGVRGFLKKPVAVGDLAEMVRKVLDEFAGHCAAKDKSFYPS